jgi:hypothetical protein
MNPAGININVRNVGEARAANIASQRLSAASGQGFLPGICRFCGCTESMPCTVQFNPPAYCSWFDARRAPYGARGLKRRGQPNDDQRDDVAPRTGRVD